jgi:hypothetical protein
MSTMSNADVDVTLLKLRAQMRATMVLPLCFLDTNARSDIWQGISTKDVFVTFVKDSRDIVDLKQVFLCTESDTIMLTIL